MRNSVQFSISDQDSFIRRLVYYFRNSSHFCLYNNNGFTAQNILFDSRETPIEFDYLVGVDQLQETISSPQTDSLEKLKMLHEDCLDWMMGYMAYDLKNELSDLSSSNFDGVEAHNMHFFIPKLVFKLNRGQLEVLYHQSSASEGFIRDLVEDVLVFESTITKQEGLTLTPRLTKKKYLEKIAAVKAHLQRGDIYELNYCQEFYSKNAIIDPPSIYFELNKKSPAPFSTYLKIRHLYLMSASPERYLKKVKNKVYTQPIKGTARRGQNKKEDEMIKDELFNSEKERSENVMIVDLCRNDLSRIAARNSVKVEELFGVYSFPQVHQLISTISAELKRGLHFTDAIRMSFPMGSMTGAPKIRAMQLIEELEENKRGIFSGSVGYITSDGNFDFNVVIRSILYNEIKKFVSVSVGGAITILSDSAKEYEECLLKAAAVLSILEEHREIPVK